MSLWPGSQSETIHVGPAPLVGARAVLEARTIGARGLAVHDAGPGSMHVSSPMRPAVDQRGADGRLRMR